MQPTANSRARGICELNEEELQEMKKDKPDMMTLYQISAERADLEDEIYNIEKMIWEL